MTPSPVASRIRSIEAAAVAGLVFAVLSFISLLLLTSPPDPAAPDSEIITWYSDPANRGGGCAAGPGDVGKRGGGGQ